jgi:hypothetical protein
MMGLPYKNDPIMRNHEIAFVIVLTVLLVSVSSWLGNHNDKIAKAKVTTCEARGGKFVPNIDTCFRNDIIISLKP